MNNRDIINKLFNEHDATDEELLFLLDNIDEDDKAYLISKAEIIREEHYSKSVYMRGLIEFTNYCVRNCEYCGIRAKNKNADRYRLSIDEILSCCEMGNRLGYKTFVLQGGEDPYYTDDVMVEIIEKIKEKYPDNAITLSIGERSYESYKRMFEAGVDRYLLRHETASRDLYESLHPGASFDNRRKCLQNLKDIGYQIGAGFMVGLPNQGKRELVMDLRYLKELQPHMCGIGPFIPHKDTSLKDEKPGTVEMTTTLLAIIRLILPEVLLPATTALGTISPNGREQGIKAGANVVMPNLSPLQVRDKYSLYNGKICTGDEAAECRICIEKRINSIGYYIDSSRGDNTAWSRNIWINS